MDAEFATHLVAIIVSFGVGVPVIARAIRGHDWPAGLLGAALVFDGVEWLSWSIAVTEPVSDMRVGAALAIVCRLAISAAAVCMLAFTVSVFRRGNSVARASAFALGAALGAGFLGSGAVGDWGGWRSDHPWVWVELGTQLLVYGWATWEPLAYHAVMRRRVALGLTSPLVAHRCLLWSAYAGMFLITQIGYMATFALPESPPALGLLLTWLTISGEVALWLAFFPPARYARWIESQRRTATIATDALAGSQPEPEVESGT